MSRAVSESVSAPIKYPSPSAIQLNFAISRGWKRFCSANVFALPDRARQGNCQEICAVIIVIEMSTRRVLHRSIEHPLPHLGRWRAGLCSKRCRRVEARGHRQQIANGDVANMEIDGRERYFRQKLGKLL